MLTNVFTAVIGAFLSAAILATAIYAFVNGHDMLGVYFVLFSVLVAGNHWHTFWKVANLNKSKK